MEIHNTGYWITETPKHWFDGKLYHFISKILENKKSKSGLRNSIRFECSNNRKIRNYNIERDYLIGDLS